MKCPPWHSISKFIVCIYMSSSDHKIQKPSSSPPASSPESRESNLFPSGGLGAALEKDGGDGGNADSDVFVTADGEGQQVECRGLNLRSSFFSVFLPAGSRWVLESDAGSTTGRQRRREYRRRRCSRSSSRRGVRGVRRGVRGQRWRQGRQEEEEPMCHLPQEGWIDRWVFFSNLPDDFHTSKMPLYWGNLDAGFKNVIITNIKIRWLYKRIARYNCINKFVKFLFTSIKFSTL